MWGPMPIFGCNHYDQFQTVNSAVYSSQLMQFENNVYQTFAPPYSFEDSLPSIQPRIRIEKSLYKKFPLRSLYATLSSPSPSPLPSPLPSLTPSSSLSTPPTPSLSPRFLFPTAVAPRSRLLLPTAPRKSFLCDNKLSSRRPLITNPIPQRIIASKKSQSYAARPTISSKSENLFRIKYRIHDGFTSSEETIIRNALKIVTQRLTKPHIRQNMYKICGRSRYFLKGGVWPRSQLENHKNYYGKHDLLRYQLMCLKVRGEKDQFPTIHSYPFHEKSTIQGKGTIGCVSFISHGSTFSTEGEFNVKLNRYKFNARNRNGSDPLVWAGTIVHEMLHNLGHGHSEGDYTDHWQINVFKKCFMQNGNYRP